MRVNGYNRTRICWGMAQRISVLLPYSTEEVYLVACRAYDLTDGDVEQTKTLTMLCCKAAQALNSSLATVRIEKIAEAWALHPGPWQKLEQRLRGMEHPEGCDCLSCAVGRLRRALRALGHEVLKAIGLRR